MSKVRITQNRSIIGQSKKQKLTMQALGLRKINRSVEVELTPQIQGMIDKVRHIVSIDEL